MNEKFISEEEYSKILDLMPICCVDLIVKQEKQVLLVLRENKPAKNVWSFPGGRIFKGEKLEEAVLRKAKQEIGIDVKILSKIGVYETIFKEANFKNVNSGTHTINIVFIVEPIKDFKIKLDPTHSKLKWVNKIDNSLYPYVKGVLTDSGVFD